jgi:hypothetical protein
LHRHLRFGFIFGPVGSGWNNSGLVVRCQLSVRWRDRGFVAMGLYYRTFKIIRDYVRRQLA